jgi:hypothetical protein
MCFGCVFEASIRLLHTNGDLGVEHDKPGMSEGTRHRVMRMDKAGYLHFILALSHSRDIHHPKYSFRT